eukprot:8164093-Ditylum_brightwellii.AAC.1
MLLLLTIELVERELLHYCGIAKEIFALAEDQKAFEHMQHFWVLSPPLRKEEKPNNRRASFTGDAGHTANDTQTVLWNNSCAIHMK